MAQGISKAVTAARHTSASSGMKPPIMEEVIILRRNW
jgi:hypothetical protein